MKKSLLTFAAILCCTMTIMFTACSSGGDDDRRDYKLVGDTNPGKVAMKFSFQNTEEMLAYCNIEIHYDNGKGTSKTFRLTKDEAGMDKMSFVWSHMFSGDLPATFTVSRKVTLATDITALDSVSCSKGYSYDYIIYNAEGEKLDVETPSYSTFEKTTYTGEQVAKLIRDGRLDLSYVFTFDENGNMTRKSK